MRFKLDTKSIARQLSGIENQHSTVTVQNASLRYPDQPLVTVKSVLGYLEQKRGVLSKAMSKASQDQIETLAQAFVDMAIDPKSTTQAILERESAAIVTDPIHNKEYGRNSQARIDQKGFDWYGVETKLLIRSIKGKYVGRKYND